MKTILFISSLIFWTSCITIEKLESRKVDDGSSSVSKAESIYLSDFKLESFSSKSSPNQFQYINKNQLISIAKKNNYTIGVIYASWCPVCHTYLSTIRTWTDSLKLLQNNVGLVLIEQNVNIGYTQELLAKNNYPFLSYIIDPQEYGTDESTKQDKFLNAFNPKRKTNEGGVPTTVILDSNGNIIREIGGKKITLSMLLAEIKH